METPDKNRNPYFSTYYQRNKEKKKQQRRENYAQKQAQKEQEKKQKEQADREQRAQIYTAKNISILLNLKEYTELNSEKRKLWANFVWTLTELAENIQAVNIAEIQQLELLAGNLVRDYYQTAQKQSGMTSQWKSLDAEKQTKLIKYWAREKVLNSEVNAWGWEMREKKASELEKEIALAKFHEERGKENCSCSDCQERQEIRREVKREYDEYWQEKEPTENERVESDCGNCGERKKVSVDSGLCRKCERAEEE